MSEVNVLLIAGTHGNEVNGPWLFDQWEKNLDLVKTSGITLSKVIGNPIAREVCKRYLDCDLNRSFSSELWDSFNSKHYEIKRAQELFNLYGPEGQNPCQIAIDFHSTTSAMGGSLVVYGRRFADLALASLIQFRLGLPIYLHEGNPDQNGFLVESWPCGLVVEIGPVPQGLIHQRIISQTRLILEVCLEELAKFQTENALFPKAITVHRHLKNIDFPRDEKGFPDSFIHENLQNKNWFPINIGHPLFQSANGMIYRLSEIDSVVPVFINEAAYIEKNIAFAFTKRERWPFNDKWMMALKELII
tara:strand:- start:1059 stop:1970 length:912 start_codon:yes stop_codon:yes gene_type:complete